MKLYILGKNTDDKGSQLEDLTRDILASQGYENIVANTVYSGGSEIDVAASYKKQVGIKNMDFPVICECKAHDKAIVMTDWLKFIGKLYIEKLKNEHTIGLMIALSGANGNVVGSYNDIKDKGFIQLIANDDLIVLLAKKYSLSELSSIEEYVNKFTDRILTEICLAYYNKLIYWIVVFAEGEYTVISHNYQAITKEQTELLLPLISNNTPFTNYINIEEEHKAIARQSILNTLILSFLMDCSEITMDEVVTKIQLTVNEENATVNLEDIKSAIKKNPFVVQSESGSLLLLDEQKIDFIEFYRFILKSALHTRVLSREYYVEHVNEDLLKRICSIQKNINIPTERINDCLFLLQHSLTALSYAIYPDQFIKRYRSSNGTPFSNVDKGHTEHFFDTIINCFIEDFHRPELSELYFNDYKIFSLNMNLSLNIEQEDKPQRNITENKTMMFGRLEEQYNNKVVLLSKLPEN